MVRRPSQYPVLPEKVKLINCMRPIDRIKDTIATLQSDNARLTKENLDLRQRVARVELRNAALEQGEDSDSSIAPPGWAHDDEPYAETDDDASSWVSSVLDDEEEMSADKSDDGWF